MGRAMLLLSLTFLNVHLITKVCSDELILVDNSNSNSGANDCVTKSMGIPSENQASTWSKPFTTSEQLSAFINKPLLASLHKPLTSSETQQLTSLETPTLSKTPPLTTSSVTQPLVPFSNLRSTSSEIPPLTLFHQDGDKKGTLVEMKNLPGELHLSLTGTGRNLDNEYRYGTINTKSLDTTMLSNKLRAPFLFVAHQDSTRIREEMKTFVFVLFHGLTTTDKKDPGFSLMVKTLLEMLNYEYEAKNVRYIFYCPNYSEESRKSLRQTVMHVQNVLNPFLEMLKADKLIAQCSLHFLGHSMGGIVIRMLLAKPSVGHPFYETKGQMDKLGKLQTNLFKREEYHKLRLVSVVSVGSPHWGVGGSWIIRMALRCISYFRPKYSLQDLSHNDKGKVLFKLALAESKDMSYMKKLGKRVCFYAGQGDEFVEVNSALGLTRDKKLSREIKAEKTIPVPVDARTMTEAERKEYNNYKANKIPSSIKDSFYGTSLLISTGTYQRFVFNLKFALKRWISISSYHNNIKGASVKNPETEKKLMPLMYHVVSKLVCPLAKNDYEVDFDDGVDGIILPEVLDNPDDMDPMAVEEDLKWRLSFEKRIDNE